MKRFLGPLLILLCTVIWGSAFSAQVTADEHYGPFALTCYRNLLAALFLAAVIFLRGRTSFRSSSGKRTHRAELVGGCASGVVLFTAMVSQQLGISCHATPGESAFLTANYVLIVPLLAWIVGRGRPGWSVWTGVVLSLAGTYLLMAGKGDGGVSFAFGPGEFWTLLCALLFAVQIMVVDRFAPNCDVLVFSMVQMFVASVCAAPFIALPSESALLSFAHFKAGWLSLFYVGVMSSGIAYTLQNLGQAYTPPALAAIVMSMESVFGALFGWLLLGSTMSPAQIAGCALVFTAVILSQLTSMKKPQKA